MQVPYRSAPPAQIPGSPSGGVRNNTSLGAPTLLGATSADAFKSGWSDWGPARRGMTELANVGARIGVMLQRQRDDATVDDAYAKLSEAVQTYTLDPESGVLNLRGEAAMGIVPGTKSFYEKQVSGLSKNMSPDAQREFQKRAMAFRTTTQGMVARHERDELHAWRLDSVQASADAHLNNALINFPNDGQFAEHMGWRELDIRKKAAMQGLSEEGTNIAVLQDWSKANALRVSEFTRIGDFDRAFDLLKNSPMMAADRLSAQRELAAEQDRVWLNKAKRQPFAVHEAQQEKVLSLAARFESGKDGIAAINPNDGGGASYGKYQISEAAGTFDAWMDYLRTTAPDVATVLGAARTSGKKGAVAEAWKEIAKNNPDIFNALQQDFIWNTHYRPALNGLAPELRARVDGSLAMQQALASAAIQHGPGERGAKGLFAEAWARSGGDERTFINQVYALREQRYGHGERYRREKETLLAQLNDVRPADPQSPDDLLDPMIVNAGFSLAESEVEAQRKAAADKKADAIFTGLKDTVQSAPPEMQDKLVSEAVARIPDHESQKRVSALWKEHAAIRDEEIAKRDGALAASFMEDMRKGNRTSYAALQHLPTLKEKGMSNAGLDKMRARLEKGELDKETPANKDYTNTLYKLIDDGAITVPEQVTALAFEGNLTKKQADGLKDYLAGGGKDGAQAMLWTKVDTAYKRLVPGRKGLKNDANFMGLFLKSADMERLHREGEKYINHHTANLIHDGEETGGFLWDTDMKYGEAVKKGVDGKWLPMVSAEEERRYKNILTSKGKSYKNAFEWKQAIREYKKYDVMGIPRPRQTGGKE